MTKKGVRGCPSPDKTLAFCLKGTSTFFDRKMRPRRRLWLRLTQAACKRVSSSCTLYDVFGNFAWRSAPPRKRVTQSEKAPNCETERCPAFRLSVDSLLQSNKGNGNGGNSVRKGESFTPPFGGFNEGYDKQVACSLLAKRKRFVGFNQNSPSVALVRHLPHRGRQGEEGFLARQRTCVLSVCPFTARRSFPLRGSLCCKKDGEKFQIFLGRGG